MPHVLRLKDGKLITPFDLEDVLEIVEEYAGDEKISRTQMPWKKNWTGCTGSMKRIWNAWATISGRS